jgi:ribonuclease III
MGPLSLNAFMELTCKNAASCNSTPSCSSITMAKRSGDDGLPQGPERKRRRHEDLNLSQELAGVLEKCEDLLKVISALSPSLAPTVALEVKEKLQLDGIRSKPRRALQLLDSHFASLSQPDDHHEKSLQSPLKSSQEARVTRRLQVPSMAVVTKYSSSDVQGEPPLLPVLNPALEQLALTHPAVQNSGAAGNDYDRLEWLGDAYIYIISTLLVYQTFPTYNSGRMSQMRELLLRNSTLAQITAKFRLEERAFLPEELRSGGRPGGSKATEKVRQKVHGDLFEAYFAAIIESDPENGVSKACNWIKALWRPFIAHHIAPEEARARREGALGQDGTDDSNGRKAPAPDAKTRLRHAIGARGVNLLYEELTSKKKKDQDNPKLPLFTIGVYMDGWGEEHKLLGQASALSKSAAGLKAAQNALDNKKLISVYMKKKDALRAASEAAGGQRPPDSNLV